MNTTIKYAPLIMMFLISANAMGQLVPKETIVDEVYRSFIDSTFSSYYLSEDCAKLNLNTDEQTVLRTQLKNVIPAGPIEEIIAKAAIDTLPLIWTRPALANVIKCLNPVEASGVIGRQFSDTSKLSKKDIEEQKKTWLALPRMEKTVYTFSRPIFDKKAQYALIRMKWQQGMIGPNGWSTDFKSCICVLKSIKGHWRLVRKVSCVE